MVTRRGVSAQLRTSACSSFAVDRSKAPGATGCVTAPLVEAVALELLDAVLAVSVVLVLVVFALSSTTPEEDLLAEHSKGQHQASEQPLSVAAIPIMILIRKSVAISLKSQLSLIDSHD
jgi:hypothetical protein